MYTHSNNSVDSNSTKLEPPQTMLNINYSDREYFQQGSNFGENWARLNQLYQHSKCTSGLENKKKLHWQH